MEFRTELLRETEEGAVYRVNVEPAGRSAEHRAGRRSAALDFTVTPSGGLIYDNRQPDARLCERRRISLALAEAMIRAARERVPGAQAERTLKGAARELRIHSRAYALGLKRSHTVTAELGSPDPASPDYDDNAAWFERPLRSLPRILKAFFRK